MSRAEEATQPVLAPGPALHGGWLRLPSLEFVLRVLPPIYLVGFLAWVLAQPYGEAGVKWFSDVTLTSIAVLGGLLLLVRALLARVPERGSWILLAGGATSWGVGMATWTFYELILGQETPFPSLADVGFLLMIPLMFAGLVTLPTGQQPAEGRFKVALDAFIAMFSIATFSWFTVLGPIASLEDKTWFEKAISFTYPAGDVLLLFALIGGLARGWLTGHGTVVLPLIAGITSFTIADMGFAYLTSTDAYQSGHLVDLGWGLGILLMVYAGVRACSQGIAQAAPVTGSASPLPSWLALGRRYLVYVLVVGVLLLLVFSSFFERTAFDSIFVALALATVVLILARQFVTLRENERLNADLRSLSRRLEARVQERTTKLSSLHGFASALTAATSSDDVCRVALKAFRGAVQGSSAVFYRLEGREWVAVAWDPAPPLEPFGPPPNLTQQLSQPEVIEWKPGLQVIGIPVAERDAERGFVGIAASSVHEPLDAQTLATMGAEFGIAFENARRFEEARANDARFRSLVQNASDIFVVVGADATIYYESPSAARVLGEDSRRLVGAKLTERLHPKDVSRALIFLDHAAVHHGSTPPVEWRWRVSDGNWRDLEVIATNLLQDPNVRGIVLNARDVSERKALEEELLHQAFHDPLTGLANRLLFQERVTHALATSRRREKQFAVLFLDLDNFKTINDSLGHATGDELLTAAAQRVRGATREGDTVARLGGDEFAILLEDVQTANDATAAAGRIISALETPFFLRGREVLVRASIGIAIHSASEDSTEVLLRNADVAMYTAKERGKGRYQVFEPGMHTALLERLQLEGDLQRAIERKEFTIHYQPIVALATGRITGLEALVRWNHPNRGLIPPADFIPVAEETGLIVPIGRWVLGEACHRVGTWQRQHPTVSPISVSVNLSGRQLQDANLVEDVAHVLRESELDPSTLVLEITESVLMQDLEETCGRLEVLRELGVRPAIDDFGSGYSSLNYLRRLPVDILKIDKLFVDGITGGHDGMAVVEAVVNLGRTMNLTTVAEGVEFQAQLDVLRQMGCDFGQGYLFSHPLEFEAVTALLDEPSSRAPELRTIRESF